MLIANKSGRILARVLALASCLWVGTLSGAFNPTPASPRLLHDLADPGANGAFDYIDLSFAQYEKTVIGSVLPENHSLSLYVQRLVDQLDIIARVQLPKQLAGVPRPKIAIRKTPDVGAFTADYKRVCYEVPIVITEGVPDIPSNRLKAIQPSPGHLSPTIFVSCSQIPVPKNRYGEFATWYTKRFTPCGLTLRKDDSESSDPALVMTGPCREEDFYPKKSSTAGIVTQVAPNRILVFSGLFNLMKSENEFLAVIAHELSHFYRAHVADVRKYDYCYKITPKNHGHRPKPDPSMNDLCEKLHPRIGFSVEEATQRQLGVYTAEQEADEMGLEILAMAGIPPSAAVEAWFSLSGKLAGTSNSEPAIPMDECMKLRSNGWRDTQGRDVFIPVGDYYDSHHSWCYRIHNIDKEIEAHQYVPRPRAFSPANWVEIQTMAKNLK